MIAADDVSWRLVTDLLDRRFGIQWDESRRSLLESRLSGRLAELRLSCLLEYYHYLKYHPEAAQEMHVLRRALTNNETYFFRETHQLDLLARHVVPGLSTSAGEPVRVLSAGCSSGEEVYSIVIALQEAAALVPMRTWQVDGCDLNPARIAQARAGVYEATSMRACDAARRERHFDRQVEPGTGPDGAYAIERWSVKPLHRKGTRFFDANLVDPPTVWAWASGVYDVIFCRNVLIYFSTPAFDAAISLFARLLAPGGWLFLGHAESLIDRRTDFEPVSLGGSIVYRRVEPA